MIRNAYRPSGLPEEAGGIRCTYGFKNETQLEEDYVAS